MLNFASLFSQFRSQAGGLGDLLDQPGVSMGRLLDEETFLNEYKSASNPKVAEFMTYERYKELIEFVTVVGPPEDKKRSYKYPLAACDLLCLDHPNLIENLFPSQPIRSPETVVEDVEEEVDQKIQDDVPLPIQKEEVPVISETPSEETVVKEKEEKISQGMTEQLAKSSEQPKQPQPTKIQTQKEPQVLVVKYRKVKVTRKQERIVEKELSPLIDRLMAYFDGEINYTLAGYVSKVLSFLCNKKTPQFIEYFLQPNFTEAILNHAESRSVGELIVKVLTHESQTCLPERKTFFQAMLRRLSDNSEVYIMSNLSAYVVDVIEKAAVNLKGQNRIVQFADIFFSLETITQIIRNVMSDQENVSVYSSPALLAFLTSVPFVMPEDEAVRSKFTELVEEFIEKSCVKLNVRAQDHPRIGLGRMKVVEILRFVLKEDILNSRLLIAKRESFFEILLTLLREYPLSSLLHNQIIKIIQLAITDNENSPLNQAILRNNALLNFIRDQVQEDKKIRAGESVYKSRKGFIAHLINIATKLRETAQQNTTIRAAIESPEYSEIYQSFFEKEIFNSKKSLAGFLIKRDPKHHEVKFQKEDIIAAYATFLKKCPPPVFEEPEPTADSHPDLVEELQKQIEENLNIKHKEEKHEAPKPVENKVEPSASTENNQEWVLSYDIEEIVLDW